MKILFICPYLPCPIKTRTFNILKCLRRKNSVDVVYLLDNEKHISLIPRKDRAWIIRSGNYAYLSKISSYVNVFKTLLDDLPFQMSFCKSSAIEEIVKNKLKSVRYDLIHVEGLRALQYVPRNCSTPVFFDSVDCMTHRYSQYAKNFTGLKRYVYQEEARRLRIHEPRLLSGVSHIFVTTSREKMEIKKICSTKEVTVISNGVDSKVFYRKDHVKNERTKDIIFSGKMDYPPNKDGILRFVNKIMPLIWNKIPDARLIIAGSSPDKEISRLQGKHKGKVIVTGLVPNLSRYIRSSRVAVCPIETGSGIQNKILESLSCGTPVVCSHFASLGLLPHQSGVVISKSDKEFAKNTVFLLSKAKTIKSKKIPTWIQAVNVMTSKYRNTVRNDYH